MHTVLTLAYLVFSQNAFVGWYQEKAAGDVVAKLKADIALKALVVRNGQETEMMARDIVPGDICIIEVGLHTHYVRNVSC